MKFRQLQYEAHDCTAPYEVTDFKAKTVGEFVNEVVASRPKEWGTISVKHDGMFCGPKICEYRYGKVLGKIDDVFRDREIEPTVFASGGWTRMDYKLKLKETMETMEKKTENVKELYWKDGYIFKMSNGKCRMVWGDAAIDRGGFIPKDFFKDDLVNKDSIVGECVVEVYKPNGDAKYFDDLTKCDDERLLWRKCDNIFTKDELKRRLGIPDEEDLMIVG